MEQPPAGTAAPSPVPFIEAVNAFHRTAVIKAAVELDVFTTIDNGHATAADIGKAVGAADRGARILCDQLVIMGLLAKAGDRYALTPDSATFLSRKSPAYLGSVTQFLLSPTIVKSFDGLTEAVRKGGTALAADGTLVPEHDVWVHFARAMAPMMAMPADGMAKLVLAGSTAPMRVLDVSASHGLFGLAFARQNPAARVTGLDWANVLPVARENAARMNLADRYDTIAGSAFDAPLGGPYDVVLLPNFLHHFDPPTCQTLLRRVRAALKPDGRVATLEFVPNDDRVSPPGAATFSLVMLASTPAGDAYTFAEYDRMFRAAGFGASALHRMGESPHAVIVTRQ